MEVVEADSFATRSGVQFNGEGNDAESDVTLPNGAGHVETSGDGQFPS
jgi:hypothetical protein